MFDKMHIMFTDVVDRVSALDDDALTERLRQIELEERQLAAEKALVVAEAERRQVHLADGHRSTKGWLIANTNCSPARATRSRRLAKLVDSVPDAGNALHAGRIGIDQADELARARANPRCGERLSDSADILLDHAEHLSFDDFRVCARRWESLADLDGAHRDRAVNVDHRRAIVTDLNKAVFVQATGGSALEAEELVKIFDHFVEREFAADAAERTGLHGPDAPTSLLPRTDAQRRFDAMKALFRAAIADPDAGKPAGIVLNIIADPWTFETALAGHGLAEAPDDLVEPHITERHCETACGLPVLPDDIAHAALTGHVRRVLVESAGVITKAGRLRRLYTGPIRDLAKLMGRRCNHPGCTVPADLADVDHLDEWDRDDGDTDLANSGIRCSTHNRFKHRAGLRVRRDRQGRLFTFRADGTPMHPVGRTPPSDLDFLTHRELFELNRRPFLERIGRAPPD